MGVRSPFNFPAQAQPAPAPPDSATAASALPPGIYPTSPLAQVIRLTQAGVDESIIMTYVTNSGSTFNLDSDKIIYLKDIGLPNGVVTAMIRRDQQLQQQMTASAYQPPAQPAPAPPPVPTEQPETAPPPQPVEQPAEVTVDCFYDTLAPYGTWVYVDGYGQCWRPSVVVYNPGWQPYCDHGHWVYTGCGWYWFSDYSWGWAPFHYGRWFRDTRWGWCWTPDTIWGPSWVTWRYSSGYCGWAPLPPFATYQAGIGFFYRGSAVSIGFNWGLSENCFAFVPTQYFCDPHPYRYRAVPAQVRQIFNQTTVINNFNVHNHNFVNDGIAPEHITAVTHTPIRPVAIRNTTFPSGDGVRGDQLSRDGNTLIIGRPPQSGFPAQNRSSQPNNNWPASQTRQIRQPQEDNAISVPAQRPSLPGIILLHRATTTGLCLPEDGSNNRWKHHAATRAISRRRWPPRPPTNGSMMRPKPANTTHQPPRPSSARNTASLPISRHRRIPTINPAPATGRGTDLHFAGCVKRRDVQVAPGVFAFATPPPLAKSARGHHAAAI